VRIVTNGSLHKVRNPERYDLIIVDEAHRFRNDTAGAFDLLQKICKTDTRRIGDVLGTTITDRGWAPFLARESVLENWADIVGDDVAAHTIPEITDELVTVRCDSSAWATNLRIMRHEILAGILARFPDSGLLKISVVGPGVPNQIRGPRSVKWRGPRDTYG
jgi:predicted nucleic acid-binding Zn ribbon protein